MPRHGLSRERVCASVALSCDLLCYLVSLCFTAYCLLLFPADSKLAGCGFVALVLSHIPVPYSPLFIRFVTLRHALTRRWQKTHTKSFLHWLIKCLMRGLRRHWFTMPSAYPYSHFPTKGAGDKDLADIPVPSEWGILANCTTIWCDSWQVTTGSPLNLSGGKFRPHKWCAAAPTKSWPTPKCQPRPGQGVTFYLKTFSGLAWKHNKLA